MRAQAEALHRDGMPFQLAMAVARDALSFEDAIARMARAERTETLMARHQLARSVAAQIAHGHLSLDVVLARRRFVELRETDRDRSSLVVGAQLGLAQVGGARPTGEVLAVGPYDLTMRWDSGGEAVVRKMDVKYVHDAAELRRVRKATRTDKARAADPPEVPTKPQHRYPLKDQRLFDALAAEEEMGVRFVDGELLRGHVTWFSRFEFGMTLKNGAPIGVLRHALCGFSAASDL